MVMWPFFAPQELPIFSNIAIASPENYSIKGCKSHGTRFIIFIEISNLYRLYGATLFSAICH